MVGDLQACKLAYLKPRREEPQQPKAGLYMAMGLCCPHLLRGEDQQNLEGRKVKPGLAAWKGGLGINNTIFLIK